MVAFQNAFQSGQQFALEQDARVQNQRILDEENLRAAEKQAADERQQLLTNQRLSRIDEEKLTQQGVLNTFNVRNFERLVSRDVEIDRATEVKEKQLGRKLNNEEKQQVFNNLVTTSQEGRAEIRLGETLTEGEFRRDVTTGQEVRAEARLGETLTEGEFRRDVTTGQEGRAGVLAENVEEQRRLENRRNTRLDEAEQSERLLDRAQENRAFTAGREDALERKRLARNRDARDQRLSEGVATKQDREEIEAERKDQARAALRAVDFVEKAIEVNMPPEVVAERLRQTFEALGEDTSQISGFVEGFYADPSTLELTRAALRSSIDRRQLGQPVEIRMPDGTVGLRTSFSDGSETFEPNVTLTERDLSRGRLVQGAERIAQREPGFRSEVKEAEVVGAAKGEIVAQDLPPSQRATAKGKRAADARKDRFKFVSGTIDTAIEQAEDGFVTGFFSLTRFIPGTSAANLDSTLKTIQANVGFAELQRLRDGSKTGGALGQISELENLLLQAVLGSVEQSQTKKQFIFNLKALKAQIKISNDRVADAFEQDFGVAYAGPGTPIPDNIDNDIEDLLDKFAPVGEN